MGEIYWKYRTAGHLVFWKPWPVYTGHIATAFFVCIVCFLFAAIVFCLQRMFFVCSDRFLFAAHLFCLQRSFFVCSMSLVGHRKLLRDDAYNCPITSAWRVQRYNYGWNQACWWPIRFENFDIVVINGLIGCFRSKMSDLTCPISNIGNWTGQMGQLSSH